MNTSLELLKQYKGGVKEFSFIKKVSDYIAENYAEIQDELSADNIREILQTEIKFKNLAFYSDPEHVLTLRKTNNCNKWLYVEVNEVEGEEKKFEACFNDDADFEHAVSQHWSWRTNVKVALEELYFIVDEEALSQARLEYMTEEQEKEQENMLERHKRQIESFEEEKMLRDKYEDQTTELWRLKEFDALELAQTPAERYKAYKEFVVSLAC